MIRLGASLCTLLLSCLPATSQAATGDNGTLVDTYLSGGTYSTLRGSTSTACAAACAEDRNCKAWSLTPPTFRAGPKCELKSTAGRAVTQAAAVSGTVSVTTSVMSKPARAEPVPPIAAAQPQQPAEASRTMVRTRSDAAPQTPVQTMPPREPAPLRPQSESAAESQSVQSAPAPQPTSNADRPWPGLRREDSGRVYTPPPEGNRPLPSRQNEGVPSYSVQELKTMPEDYEDSAGLQGRLPSGQSPEEERPEESED